MRPPRPSKFGEPVSERRRSWIAAATVVLGSLTVLVPVVATLPLLPPFGLLVLLAWRLRNQAILPVWAGLPLGLFDDLVSGQSLGSAMALWTAAIVMIDIVDSRLVWRDFWQDWVLAGACIAGTLILQRLVAAPLLAHVDTVILLQIVISVALYPLVALVCARIDERGRRLR